MTKIAGKKSLQEAIRNMGENRERIFGLSVVECGMLVY